MSSVHYTAPLYRNIHLTLIPSNLPSRRECGLLERPWRGRACSTASTASINYHAASRRSVQIVSSCDCCSKHVPYPIPPASAFLLFSFFVLKKIRNLLEPQVSSVFGDKLLGVKRYFVLKRNTAVVRTRAALLTLPRVKYVSVPAIVVFFLPMRKSSFIHLPGIYIYISKQQQKVRAVYVLRLGHRFHFSNAVPFGGQITWN